MTDKCKNGATYTNDVDDQCSCQPGFTGDTCANIDYCAGVTCSDHGTCTNGFDAYTCNCDAGYSSEDDCATTTTTTSTSTTSSTITTITTATITTITTAIITTTTTTTTTITTITTATTTTFVVGGLECDDRYGESHGRYYVVDTTKCWADAMNAAFNEEEELMDGCSSGLGWVRLR